MGHGALGRGCPRAAPQLPAISVPAVTGTTHLPPSVFHDDAHQWLYRTLGRSEPSSSSHVSAGDMARNDREGLRSSYPFVFHVEHFSTYRRDRIAPAGDNLCRSVCPVCPLHLSMNRTKWLHRTLGRRVPSASSHLSPGDMGRNDRDGLRTSHPPCSTWNTSGLPGGPDWTPGK
jgi:hypothetical protein